MNGLFGAMGIALFSCFASSANAIENWTIIDLGSTRTESLCVKVASNAFISFSNIYGVRRVLHTSWTVYGYGLNQEAHDAVVTCTFATANSTRATLIVYSDNSVSGGLIAQRISTLFAQHNIELEKDWLDKAYKRNGF